MPVQASPAARITLVNGPSTMLDSHAAFYTITIANLSGEPWSSDGPNPVNVAYHWYDERGKIAYYDGQRTRLPRPVEPGEAIELSLRVHPPSLAGRYVLEIDVVREGVRWFEAGERARVEVRPTTQPRAVLVNRNCIANDAVGNNIVRKLRLLRAWGVAPLLLTEYVDDRLPLEDQALMVPIDERQIVDPEPRMQWAANHFWNADLYIFDYPEYYPLLELIRMVTQGTVVFDYHSVTPPHLWGSEHSRANVERGVAEMRLVGFADYAIAHSEYTRAELLATGLIAPDRVDVVPYAVPIERFRPDVSVAPPAEIGAGNGPILLYVGRMAGNKRVDLLIEMAARVKPRYPRLKLLLVGDDLAPPYQEIVAEARRRIAAHGLQDNVVFTGPRRHDDLPAYYRACDVYVTSSEHEGFCIPVVEAMACGKPVVAAAATALPWTVGDGGLLFEPGDADDFATKVLMLLDSKYAEQVSER